MRKKITILIVALACALGVSAQETADQVVRRFLAKLDAATLMTDFTMTLTDETAQTANYTGHIDMRGKKFILNIFSTEAAYDGKTLYLYSEDTEELTLSEPTPEELLEANPVLFAEALLLQSTVRFSSTAPEGTYSIDFVPHNNSGIRKFVLRLKKATLLPTEIQVREEKTTSVLKFTNSKYDFATPSFILVHPDAFLNDLR